MKKMHILLAVVLFMTITSCTSGGEDEGKVRTYTASGTYTYSDGTLTMNWTNSDFLCNGPKDGFINTKTDVTVSNTTLTWSDYNDNDVMTWTRESGTADDPAGTWTTTDLEGNTHVLTIEVTDSTSGTMSLSATIHLCAGDFFPADSAVCGNATCESGENESNCPNDCAKATCATGLCSNLGRISPMCAKIKNNSSNQIWWKGTWVADHSFGWTEVRDDDYSCRHYGGTIFNSVYVKDSNGKIFHLEPYAMNPLYNQYVTYIYMVDGNQVISCGPDQNIFPWCIR